MNNGKHKFYLKLSSVILSLITVTSLFSVNTFGAGKFPPKTDLSNPGVKTQYVYSENNPSWLRQLTVKEDMLSAEGIATESVLYPKASYPYRTDAASFKEEVNEYVKTFTLDEESRKAAYIYLLNQIGALSLITEPPTDGISKAEWLRRHGITVTKEEENDPDSAIMINALYSLMRNDLYYVLKGKHLTIPEGTTLQGGVLLYLMALSERSSALTAFIEKYLGQTEILTLEDYIYYTSLLTIFTNGYVSIVEIPNISRAEVYKRLAVMTIRQRGISVDASASEEEIQIKYLAAMLGDTYDITVDPDTLKKDVKKGNVAYYILRRMAYEDADLTISQSKYSYEQAFKLVASKTNRFDLENEFYSDITDYNVYLKNYRDSIYVNPNPLSSSGVTLLINGSKAEKARYAKIPLSEKSLQTIGIGVTYSSGKTKKTTYYRLTIHQGSAPAEGSNLTGIIASMGDVTVIEPVKQAAEKIISAAGEPVSLINKELPEMYALAKNALTLNEKGQLVDENGNVVSDKSYQPLPEGYRYTIDSAGKIVVVKAEDEESTTAVTVQKQTTEEANNLKMIIIICSAILFLLIVTVIIIIVTSKKKKSNKKNPGAKKAKEKKKEQKKQNKKDKKK